MFLHKLGHIDTHHRVIAVEHKVSQRFTQLSFTDTGWPQEKERADWTIRIGQPRTATTNGVRYRFDRFVLSNDALMQILLHTQQFLTFAFHHASHRNTRPARQHFGNLGIRHFITQQTHGFAFRLRGNL